MKMWMLDQVRQRSESSSNEQARFWPGSRLARNALAASDTGLSEGPGLSRRNRFGITVPSLVRPTKGAAVACSARSYMFLMNPSGGTLNGPRALSPRRLRSL